MQSVLVLCRGLFTPGYNKEGSRVHDNVHGVALREEQGGGSLEEAFAEVSQRVLVALVRTAYSSLLLPR